MKEYTPQQAALMALIEQYANAFAHPKDETEADSIAREIHAQGIRQEIEAIVCAPRTDVVAWPEPVAWRDAGDLRAGSKATAYRVVTQETKQGMPVCIAASFAEDLYARPQVEAMLAEKDRQIQELRAELDLAKKEASGLAEHLFKRHYSYTNAGSKWELAGSLRGILSQIDNMCSGLSRPVIQASEKQEGGVHTINWRLP